MSALAQQRALPRGLHWCLRFFLGLVLLGAGVGKALDLPGYVEIIKSYEIGLPVWLDWVTAIAVTAVETGLALWLLAGWRTALAAVLTLALHTGYLVFLAITLLRGIDVPNCGCFGVFLSRPLQPVTLLEDLALIAVSWLLYALAHAQGRELRSGRRGVRHGGYSLGSSCNSTIIIEITAGRGIDEQGGA